MSHHQPGSKAYVEEHFGPQASFGDRIGPHLVDSVLAILVGVIPMVVGIGLLAASLPDTYRCDASWEQRCEVPGSGSGLLFALGMLAMLLSAALTIAFTIWNRVLRVARTGQSIGRRLGGLKVVDAQTGAAPDLGKAALKELVASFAGLISALWMLFDDDERTLSDKVGGEAVINVGRG